ncbi:MAG: M23 family metallopeptidase [Burkholderiaceae bacterium]
MKRRYCVLAALSAIAPGAFAAPTEDADIARLRLRALLIPLPSVGASDLQDTYLQARGGGGDGARAHEALDIPARHGTPVLAVEDGRIAKLFLSKPGGRTIYHFDDAREFAYYYAHLDGYADGLREGMRVRKGQVIGYVGSTGNAAPESPHLHFAIFRLGPERRWWRGTPINPFGVWVVRQP